MDDELRDLLEKQYRETLDVVASATGDDANLALKKLDVLSKHLMEQDKNNREQQEIYDNLSAKQKEMEIREKELNLKKDQMALELAMKEKELALKQEDMKERSEQAKRESFDRRLQTGAAVCTTAATGFMTWHWLRKTMQFEETGTFTSRASKVVSDFKRLFGK